MESTIYAASGAQLQGYYGDVEACDDDMTAMNLALLLCWMRPLRARTRT